MSLHKKSLKKFSVDSPTRVQSVVGYFLAALLTVSAVSKISSGHRPQMSVPEWLFYVAAALEFVIAVVFLTRHKRFACCLCLLLSLSSIAWTMTHVAESCGCFGTWIILDKAGQLIMAGTVGVLTSGALLLEVMDASVVPP